MPLAVLVVGGGSLGERHVRCFQQIGCDVALCEADGRRRQELVDRYKLGRSFAQTEEASSQPWHGVVIATPADQHLQYAIALAGATSALFIEAPLCTRLEDIAPLRQATSDKVVQVGYVLRVHPASQRVRELLAEGTIGQLHQITITAGPDLRREIGDVAAGDAATHLYDLVHYFTGPFDWVLGDFARLASSGTDQPDTVHLLGRAAGGKVLVSLALNPIMVPHETHVHLHGERGSLAIRLHEHRAGVLLRGDADWAWGEPLISGRDDLFRAQAQRFLAAATGQEPPLCTLDDAQQALRVSLAARDSAERNTVIQLANSPLLIQGHDERRTR